MAIRLDWEEWKDLLFLRYLSHGDFAAIMQGDEMFNGRWHPGCDCGGWRRYHKTDSGHALSCPMHEQELSAMKANPR